jgi:transposase
MDTILSNSSSQCKRYSLKYLFDNLDLSFIWDIVKQRYSVRARCRFHNPESMLKALLLKEIRQISSRRKLAGYLKSEEGIKWISILGFKKPPCHDAFSEFIKRLGVQTFDQIFRILIQKIKSMIHDFGNIIAIDSTSLKGLC